MKNLFLTLLLSVSSFALFAEGENVVGGVAGTRFPEASNLINQYFKEETSQEAINTLGQFINKYWRQQANPTLTPPTSEETQQLSGNAKKLLGKLQEIAPQEDAAGADQRMAGRPKYSLDFYEFVKDALLMPSTQHATGLLPRTGVA